MAVRRHVPAAAAGSQWEQLRSELGIDEDFDPAALEEADTAAHRPQLPELDRTDVELCTIDPAGSLDVDQAVGFERAGDGYTVHYAIADVAAFVRPGGALDAACHARGETLYAPDRRVPMLPPVLCEGASSLLPGEVRPALLWSHQLDTGGNTVSTRVERARVRSRRQLDYHHVDALVTAGGDDQLTLLREVGVRRQALALARGAVQLPSLEQEVELDAASGTASLRYRDVAASEGWNAEISLLTGMAAAKLMLEAGIGVLRTLPPPDPAAVEQIRHSASALGITWPAGASYGAVISSLDPRQPSHAALLALVPRLLRGAAYVAFDGAPPAESVHSAVAAPYAHCTAPLRRLVDRYAGEVCVAACAGARPPAWAVDALPLVPPEMAAADHRAHELDRAAIDLAEALVMAPLVGREMTAVVVSADGDRGMVQLATPAVRAEVRGQGLRPGSSLRVRVAVADPAHRRVQFDVVD